MKLSFTIGNLEKHTVEFTWGQLLGTARITVDGSTVHQAHPVGLDEIGTIARPASYLYQTYIARTTLNHLVRSWGLEVGSNEKHRIQIEKERPKLLSGLRPSVFKVFVDGDLIDERRGY
jgi:hypothetical protein